MTTVLSNTFRFKTHLKIETHFPPIHENKNGATLYKFILAVKEKVVFDFHEITNFLYV